MLSDSGRFRGQRKGGQKAKKAAPKRPGEGGMTDYRTARAVACPRCAAKPGNPCVNAFGSQMRLLHWCRWRAAKGEMI
jgi:hypothetical protein